jgi:hypothetical protein
LVFLIAEWLTIAGRPQINPLRRRLFPFTRMTGLQTYSRPSVIGADLMALQRLPHDRAEPRRFDQTTGTHDRVR